MSERPPTVFPPPPPPRRKRKKIPPEKDLHGDEAFDRRMTAVVVFGLLCALAGMAAFIIWKFGLSNLDGGLVWAFIGFMVGSIIALQYGSSGD